jgi:hypothetical protein
MIFMRRSIFLFGAAAGLAVGLALLARPLGAEERPLFGLLGDGSRLAGPAAQEGLPSPQDFLGYSLGERFTPHAYLLAYLDALDASSERLTRIDYGRTAEGRPLRLYVISSPENLGDLEELRRRNLRLADPGNLPPKLYEDLKRTQPAIVWLAFGVHGNETSSSEAALALAYTLAAAPPQGELAKSLEEMVVLIDPLVNPDGRDRYVAFYHGVAGREPDPDPRSLEHREPWPGGRTNHYMIDLNRDWVWLSQRESRARVAAYRLWEPHVYVDFHEMAVEQTYFFPPAAEPIHPLLAGNALDWMEIFGRANAEAFDRHGWLFFNHEEFDLLFPGYGDTYPSLRGAVGMTYEAGGGGRAGLKVELRNGEIKTLADRIARHYTTGLATLRTAADKRRDLVRDFAARRAERELPRTYLWPADRPEAGDLARLLESHGIAVRQLERGQDLKVHTVMPGGEVERSFRAGTWAASTEQPLGRLLRALFDAEPVLDEALVAAQAQRVGMGLDAEFYDSTAWSLPLAMNLETWVHEGQVSGLREPGPRESGIRGEGGAAVLLPPQGLDSYRAVFRLAGEGLRWRFASESIEGDAATRGSFFLPRQGNPADFETKVVKVAKELGIEFERLASSWQDDGPSLGSAKMLGVRRPRVALVGGAGVDSYSHGFLWHLFDQDLETPVSRFELSQLADDLLADLDVVVLPDGDYGRLLDDAAARRLDNWVRSGGTLIGIGGAIPTLQERGLSKVRAAKPSETPVDDPERPGSKKIELPLSQPGAILATEWVGRHPLGAGLPAPPPVLFHGAMILEATGDPRVDVLLVRRQDPVLAGVVWPDSVPRLAGSLLVARETLGRGRVVSFSQDPYFRLFWRGTTPLFLNAVLGIE